MTLVFDRTAANVGTLVGVRNVEEPFVFTVWDQGPVKIVRATTSCCGKRGIRTDLIGKVLQPGSSHPIFLTFDDRTPGEEKVIVVDIETEPPSPRPLTLTLRGIIAMEPTLFPSSVMIQTSPGIAPMATVHYSARRTPALDALKLNVSASDWAGFTAETLKSASRVAGREDTTVEEILDYGDFRIAGPVLPIGRHEFTLKVAWNTLGEKTTLPVVVEVNSPYRPKLDRLFCGALAPGAHWTYEVPLVFDSKASAAPIVELTSSATFITAQRQPNGEAIKVMVEAPKVDGRFSGQINIGYNTPNVPSSTIRVTGFVQSQTINRTAHDSAGGG